MSDTTPLHGEPLVTLTDVARRIPGQRQDRRLHPATLGRWIVVGVRTSDGRVVKLEAVRAGRRWLTSHAAVYRFFDRMTVSAGPGEPGVLDGQPHGA